MMLQSVSVTLPYFFSSDVAEKMAAEAIAAAAPPAAEEAAAADTATGNTDADDFGGDW
jgi:hypothetical protein